MPSTAQPAPETDEKKSRGLGSYVLWAFVAVMVYVLSYGPVLKFVPSNNCVMQLYTPLWRVCLRAELGKPLRMYLHFWRDDYFNEQGRFRLP
jgi:hypothetical protein